jgi:hypothetical protein
VVTSDGDISLSASLFLTCTHLPYDMLPNVAQSMRADGLLKKVHCARFDAFHDIRWFCAEVHQDQLDAQSAYVLQKCRCPFVPLLHKFCLQMVKNGYQEILLRN